MAEGPHNPYESRRTHEALKASEILAIPGVSIGVFGTERGLRMPFYFKTNERVEEGGTKVFSFSHLSPSSSLTPDELDVVLEQRSKRAEVETAFQKNGFYQQTLEVNGYLFVSLSVPSRDSANRKGYKGIFVAWDRNNEELNGKLSATFFENNHALATMLALWEEVYAHPEHTASPSNEESARTSYFSPPVMSE